MRYRFSLMSSFTLAGLRHAYVMAVRLDFPFVILTSMLPDFLRHLTSYRRQVYVTYVHRTVSFAGSRYAQFSTRFVSPLVTYPTGRYSCPLLLRLLRLFVLVVLVLLYIQGWRWDDPHLQSTLQPP